MRCVLLTRTQRHTLLQIGSKDLISTCPAGFWPCKLFAKCAISNQFGKFCPTQIWQMVRPRAECLASAYLGWGSREASSKHNMYIPEITPLAWITNMLGVLLLSSFLLLFRSMPMHCYQPQDTQVVNSCQALIIGLVAWICLYPPNSGQRIIHRNRCCRSP